MAPRAPLAGLTPGRLRLWLALLFAALALPSALLVQHAYGQLKWEAFHRQRVLAEEFAQRVDSRLAALVAAEEARPATDYRFLVVAGDPGARVLALSPLASFPPERTLPGALGHFEVEADGTFRSPLLPAAGEDPGRHGITRDALAARTARVAELRELLARHRVGGEPALAGARDAPARASADAERLELSLSRIEGDRARGAGASVAEGVAASSEPGRLDKKIASAPAQALFDRLDDATSSRAPAASAPPADSLGRVEELRLEQAYSAEAEAKRDTGARAKARQARKEQSLAPAVAPAPAAPALAEAQASEALPIRAFESEVEPFRFARLDADHFVLYRNVWRDGQRTVQGLLLAREALLGSAIGRPFAATALARASDLALAWRGEVLEAWSATGSPRYAAGAGELDGTLLHRARLSAPLGEFELLFDVTRLPPGPGATVLAWVSALLAAMLVLTFLLLYRLGLGQIRLVRQQQDFVSAVSHELKTPLTSIRMYGEMLREGWVDEGRRRDYYEFIHAESERLTRLIDNVLQLARMSRNGLQVAPQEVALGTLCEQARTRLASRVAQTGFTLELNVEAAAATTVVTADPDLFLQIVINLVDNALKFAARAEPRRVVLGARRSEGGGGVVSVRDFGPGVPRDQMKKIFRLFYRPGNELTRETAGTGIGLALVHQLAVAMGGRVDVVNRDPGAEFRVTLPPAPTA